MDQRILDVINRLANARRQKALWEEMERAYLDVLLTGHKVGEVPTDFTAAGLVFKFMPGKQTVVYPSTVTAKIKALQAEAVEANLTTIKTGDPFWRISAAKETA